MQYMSLPTLEGYELCIYEAEEKDSWVGFIAACSGWDGASLPPSEALPTYALALHTWVLRFRQVADTSAEVLQSIGSHRSE